MSIYAWIYVGRYYMAHVPEKKIRMLLAGDPLCRMKRLAARLNDDTAFDAVAVPPPPVPDGHAIVSLIARHHPDIVLYDFPGGENGIASLEEIVRLFVTVRAVALTDCEFTKRGLII